MGLVQLEMLLLVIWKTECHISALFLYARPELGSTKI